MKLIFQGVVSSFLFELINCFLVIIFFCLTISFFKVHFYYLCQCVFVCVRVCLYVYGVCLSVCVHTCEIARKGQGIAWNWWLLSYHVGDGN